MKDFLLYLMGLPILGVLLGLLHYFRSLVTMTVFVVVFGTLYFAWWMADGPQRHGRYHED